MFNRGPNDVVFLQAVRYAREKMPRGKVRMLYCDAAGKVYASVVSRSVYELARDNAARMASSHRSFATVGLESAPGRFIPTTVEIGPDEVWALEHILEHALKNGRLPDILKKHVRPIIRLVEANREAVVAAPSKPRRKTQPVVTPRVLDRLPYYPEHDIEISMPIYKAEYSYPLIVLKGLPRDEQTPPNAGRILVLDADGDIAIVKVPSRLFRSLEKGLSGTEGKSRRPACALVSRQADGLAVSYMTVSQPQKKSLETLTRYFEETGGSKQPISITARAVIVRARESTAARAIQ
ncbi:MAG: hypothetical protein ABID71_03590 [Chloroflexota bacterium]